MNDFSPVGAREHISQSRRGAVAGRDGSDAEALIFAADDAAFTRPVPILAERRIGDTGLAVFPFALGTSRLAAVDEVAAGRILHRFATRGGSLYDVGDEDGSGRSQEIFATWLAANTPAKVLTMLTPSIEREGGRASGPNRLVRAVELALTRLQRERIDLLVLDLREAARLELSLDQLLGAADELIATGKAGHLGVVGATGDQLLEARVFAGNGLPRISAVRLEWDITGKITSDAETRMVAAAQQLAFLPDATAASLALASPSLPPKVLAGWGRGARLSQAVNARVVKPGSERAADVLAGHGRGHRIGVALDRVCAELAIAPATAQLAWLLAKRGVVAPIVRVTRPEQVDLLMDAAGVRLTRAEMLELDRAVEPAR